MTFAPAALPSDPDELRAFAALLQAEVYAKTLQIDKLKAQLAALRRARFGRSSEKLDRDLGQLQLLLGEIEEGDAEATARAVKNRPDTARVQPRRRAVGRCPSICFARIWCTSRRRSARPAAAPNCARSAKTAAGSWNTCPPTSKSSCMSGRN